MEYYVIDAFADRVFSGNPAAVLLLERELPEDTMRSIAMENNLSETAFAVKNGEVYDLRWFTPGGEIDLCGHATLAAAYTVLNFQEPDRREVCFQTKSGPLTVRREGELYQMDLPALRPVPCPITPQLADALGVTPVEVWKQRDYTVLLESESVLRALTPDFAKLKALPEGLAVFVTAPSDDQRYDFVDRAFWPKLKIDEDPVCGSAHCNLTPFWSERLGKAHLVAHQVSSREGVLYLEDCGSRIKIARPAVLYARGELPWL